MLCIVYILVPTGNEITKITTQITASGPHYLTLKFLSKYFKDISDM